MFKLFIFLTLLVISLFIQLLGFLNLIPLYISSPILFIVLFIILYTFIIEIDLEDLNKAVSENETAYFDTSFYFTSNDSNSFNFSSNTFNASRIGSAFVISTPAFFNTSIG